MKNNNNSTISLINLALALLIFSTLFSNCGSDDSDQNNPKDKEEEKEEICDNTAADGYRTIVRDSETREYILHIPASYDSNTPTPLVINFHGFGGCASAYALDIGQGSSNLNAVADDANFIIAYPQGVVRAKESPEWDPGDNGLESINDNDVYFVSQLIEDISAELNVDPLRVYAVGYSNGGMMSYGLACTKSDLIAAIGIMSGIMLDGECTANEYSSIIHFHGIADEVLPIDGNQDFQPVGEVVDFWLEHNGIANSSLESTELNGGEVLREKYTGGNGNTSFVLYTVNSEFGKEGGHVWFSDEIEDDTPTEILWDFLSEYRLDD